MTETEKLIAYVAYKYCSEENIKELTITLANLWFVHLEDVYDILTDMEVKFEGK